MNQAIFNFQKNIKVKEYKKFNRGYSNDVKYLVYDYDKNIYLYRISLMFNFEKKMQEFKLLNKLANYNIDCSRALDFCVFNNNKKICIIYNWINGNELFSTIHRYNPDRRYSLGYKCGTILRQIHEVPLTEEEIKNKKTFNIQKILEYYYGPSRFEGDYVLIEFILNNYNKIKDDKICHLHGDYHLRNFIIDKKENLSIIDFSEQSIGDYVIDFSKNELFNSKQSETFALGMIEGYFHDSKIPQDFWLKYAYYTAYNCISMYMWACKRKNFIDRIDMNAKIKHVLEQFDNFNSVIPKWYYRKVIKMRKEKLLNPIYSLEKIISYNTKENDEEK